MNSADVGGEESGGGVFSLVGERPASGSVPLSSFAALTPPTHAWPCPNTHIHIAMPISLLPTPYIFCFIRQARRLAKV